MKTRFSQQGLSMLSWMSILFVVSFFVTCAVKLTPVYMDSWTVKSVIESVAAKQKIETQSPEKIRSAIALQFMTNRVEAIKARDIKITREKGKVIIDANYEKRVPLMYNVDAVVKFDKLYIEITPSASGY